MRNDRSTRASIVVHGAGPDADHSVTTGGAAASLDRAHDDVILIWPGAASDNGPCRNELAPAGTNGLRGLLSTGDVCVSCSSCRASVDVRTAATTYGDWPWSYRRTGYTEPIGDDQLKKQPAVRPTTYLSGGIDVLLLGGLRFVMSSHGSRPDSPDEKRGVREYADTNAARSEVTSVTLTASPQRRGACHCRFDPWSDRSQTMRPIVRQYPETCRIGGTYARST